MSFDNLAPDYHVDDVFLRVQAAVNPGVSVGADSSFSRLEIFFARFVDDGFAAAITTARRRLRRHCFCKIPSIP